MASIHVLVHLLHNAVEMRSILFELEDGREGILSWDAALPFDAERDMRATAEAYGSPLKDWREER